MGLASPVGAQKPIDLDVLSRHSMEDVALQCELLGLFVDQAGPLRDVLAPSASVRERAILQAVHRVRGAAQAIGAREVEGAAATLEHLLSNCAEDEPTAAAASELRARLAAATAFAKQVIVDLRPVGLAKLI